MKYVSISTVHMEMWGLRWDIAANDNFILKAIVSTSRLDFQESGAAKER